MPASKARTTPKPIGTSQRARRCTRVDARTPNGRVHNDEHRTEDSDTHGCVCGVWAAAVRSSVLRSVNATSSTDGDQRQTDQRARQGRAQCRQRQRRRTAQVDHHEIQDRSIFTKPRVGHVATDLETDKDLKNEECPQSRPNSQTHVTTLQGRSAATADIERQFTGRCVNTERQRRTGGSSNIPAASCTSRPSSTPSPIPRPTRSGPTRWSGTTPATTVGRSSRTVHTAPHR